MKNFNNSIDKFYEPIKKAKDDLKVGKIKTLDDVTNLRVISWEYCRDVFLNAHKKIESGIILTNDEIDYLALHLFAYLASWGMSRKSPVLVPNHYRIHKSIIKNVILKPEYYDLWNITLNDIYAGTYNDQIKDCYKELTTAYKKIMEDTNPKSQRKPSDTFITKIMLGTFGCVPAYDYNVKKAISYINNECKCTKIKNEIPSPFSVGNLQNLCGVLPILLPNINNDIKSFMDAHNNYTEMKVLDMYLWQLQ